ncbi:Hydrocephalus-inducing protein-like protein [Zootermopsis nevadensis]|uniref:Hydrocephalus-inducing protein-like protein n=1 Tax=Zootermopsis nevadensis TaxID=136037 RepID=A0A067R1F4_ZOONE|nr:Hydrocephalus-inducing protein-like protein [Zootermopsis nevadensis]
MNFEGLTHVLSMVLPLSSLQRLKKTMVKLGPDPNETNILGKDARGWLKRLRLELGVGALPGNFLRGLQTPEVAYPLRWRNPRDRNPVPIGQEAGWAPESVWTQRIQKNPLRPSGIELRSSNNISSLVPISGRAYHPIRETLLVEVVLLQRGTNPGKEKEGKEKEGKEKEGKEKRKEETEKEGKEKRKEETEKEGKEKRKEETEKEGKEEKKKNEKKKKKTKQKKKEKKKKRKTKRRKRRRNRKRRKRRKKEKRKEEKEDETEKEGKEEKKKNEKKKKKTKQKKKEKKEKKKKEKKKKKREKKKNEKKKEQKKEKKKKEKKKNGIPEGRRDLGAGGRRWKTEYQRGEEIWAQEEDVGGRNTRGAKRSGRRRKTLEDGIPEGRRDLGAGGRRWKTEYQRGEEIWAQEEDVGRRNTRGAKRSGRRRKTLEDGIPEGRRDLGAGGRRWKTEYQRGEEIWAQEEDVGRRNTRGAKRSGRRRKTLEDGIPEGRRDLGAGGRRWKTEYQRGEEIWAQEEDVGRRNTRGAKRSGRRRKTLEDGIPEGRRDLGAGGRRWKTEYQRGEEIWAQEEDVGRRNTRGAKRSGRRRKTLEDGIPEGRRDLGAGGRRWKTEYQRGEEIWAQEEDVGRRNTRGAKRSGRRRKTLEDGIPEGRRDLGAGGRRWKTEYQRGEEIWAQEEDVGRRNTRGAKRSGRRRKTLEDGIPEGRRDLGAGGRRWKTEYQRGEEIWAQEEDVGRRNTRGAKRSGRRRKTLEDGIPEGRRDLGAGGRRWKTEYQRGEEIWAQEEDVGRRNTRGAKRSGRRRKTLEDGIPEGRRDLGAGGRRWKTEYQRGEEIWAQEEDVGRRNTRGAKRSGRRRKTLEDGIPEGRRDLGAGGRRWKTEYQRGEEIWAQEEDVGRRNTRGAKRSGRRRKTLEDGIPEGRRDLGAGGRRWKTEYQRGEEIWAQEEDVGRRNTRGAKRSGRRRKTLEDGIPEGRRDLGAGGRRWKTEYQRGEEIWAQEEDVGRRNTRGAKRSGRRRKTLEDGIPEGRRDLGAGGRRWKTEYQRGEEIWAQEEDVGRRNTRGAKRSGRRRKTLEDGIPEGRRDLGAGGRRWKTEYQRGEEIWAQEEDVGRRNTRGAKRSGRRRKTLEDGIPEGRRDLGAGGRRWKTEYQRGEEIWAQEEDVGRRNTRGAKRSGRRRKTLEDGIPEGRRDLGAGGRRWKTEYQRGEEIWAQEEDVGRRNTRGAKRSGRRRKTLEDGIPEGRRDLGAGGRRWKTEYQRGEEIWAQEEDVGRRNTRGAKRSGRRRKTLEDGIPEGRRDLGAGGRRWKTEYQRGEEIWAQEEDVGRRNTRGAKRSGRRRKTLEARLALRMSAVNRFSFFYATRKFIIASYRHILRGSDKIGKAYADILKAFFTQIQDRNEWRTLMGEVACDPLGSIKVD